MSSYDDSDTPDEHQWGRFGFLVADLFTALTVLFLVANTVGNVTFPLTHSGAGTGAAYRCGIDPHLTQLIVAVPDPDGLLAGTLSAEQRFATQVRQQLAGVKDKLVGLVEASGEGANPYPNDIGDGQTIALHAVDSLKILARQNYIFTTDETIYQHDWDGTQDIHYGQVKLVLFFYSVSSKTCGA